MGRTNQKLINYHSINTSAVSQFDVTKISMGEIAVRNNATQPELYIKTGENTYAVFADTAKTQAMIVAKFGELESTVEGYNNVFKAFSANVATNYADKNYVNAASANAYSLASAYTYQVSGNIANHFTKYATSADVHNAINSSSHNVETLEETFKAFSANVYTNYADKTYVQVASANAYNLASAYTKEVSGNIANNFTKYATSANVHNAITAVDGKVTELDNKYGAFSANVTSNYATKDYANIASGNAYNSATAYTKEVSGNIESNFAKYATSANVHNAIDAVSTALTRLEGSVSGLSAGTIALSANVTNYINGKLSNVYTYKGSVAKYENLPTAATPGDVYNVVSGHGQTGDADYIAPGTNYAWVGASGTTAAHWDPLGGTMDLSIYATSADVESIESKITALDNKYGAFSANVETNYATKDYANINIASGNAYNSATAYTYQVSGNIANNFTKYATSANVHNAITNVDGKVTELDNKYGAFSANVETNYATKDYANIASGNAYNSATAYTKQVSGNIANHFTKYATSANVHNAITNVDGKVTELDNKYGAFSANMTNVYVPKINSALQGFQLGTVATATADSNQSSAFTKTSNNIVTLDLSNLVIDCGDF